MAFSPGPKDSQIVISTFGGLVTEMAAPNLPEGVSPDCQDVVFTPGSVASRPGLSKALTINIPAGGPAGRVPTVVYAKSYVKPGGTVENLYLDSNGDLWMEDVAATPGTLTKIGTVTPGSWAQSITAFGREYIAVSDGLHGADIPLQWDGTNLDRVTQDGPGAPPAVASVALPKQDMALSGARPVLTVTSCVPAGGYTFQVWCAAGVSGINVGDQITIAGSSVGFYNGTWTADTVYPAANLILVMAVVPAGTANGAGGTLTPIINFSMQRQSNTVTVLTGAPHQLRVGFQAQIAGVPAGAVGGGIAAISIVNEDQPGVATITTNTPHGLIPGLFVSITGVNGTAVGGGIASIARYGNVVTVTTNAAHGLSPGAVVTIGGVGTASFNTTAAVLNVNSATVFTFAQVDIDAAVGAGGGVTINWPIPATATPSYFEVLSAPSATKFQVAVNYSNGTWASGAVSYAWNGTFFVTAVPSATSFQFKQYGPDGFTTSIGTVTPYGQAAPGTYQLQVHFLTRQGYITRPSPPVSFVASGGQYISVSNIPIGPSNVVARILAFTGASGSKFFYIPSTPQINGQIVGTATQIGDNSTTDILLDFSDPTLYAALGVSIPGNDLAAQMVLDGALGFGFYGSRLVAWGQRNRLQGLVNMGFDGGYLPSSNTIAGGWTPAAAGAGGALAAGHFGPGWQTGGAGALSQGFYQDAYGAPLATALATYRLRAWVKGGSLTATISSASTGFSSTATINGTAAGAFGEAAFSLAMPAAIPADLVLSIAGAGAALVDELSILYAQNPYLDTLLYASYVNNPEGFDGLSGKFGPSQDSRKVMGIGIVRQTLCLLTQDPGGRLHETTDNGITEPAGWTVRQIASSCGLLSARALTVSQADDATASGGEEWIAWASASGARIFGGDQPWKISQEIQPNWDAVNFLVYQGPAPVRAQLSAWALNDPASRTLYFGLPVGVIGFTPSIVYAMSYRGLESAQQIAAAAPVHLSASGRLTATDRARKWAPWNLKLNGAVLLYSSSGKLRPIFLSGNGYMLGSQDGYGQVYSANAGKLTDDDYGQIAPRYMIYFLPSGEQEDALQIFGGRKLLVYLSAFVSGTGSLTIVPYCDTLANAWPVTGLRALTAAPTADLEWTGGNAQGQRIALKFSTAPAVGTDNGFNLQRITVWLRRAAHLPVRGSV